MTGKTEPNQTGSLGMVRENACPECGAELLRCEDPFGVAWQCHAPDCLSTFSEGEIVEPDHIATAIAWMAPPLAQYLQDAFDRVGFRPQTKGEAQ